MPKIVPLVIATNIGTRTVAPGVTNATLRDVLWDIENQRREGKTDAHEALKSVFVQVETQRRGG